MDNETTADDSQEEVEEVKPDSERYTKLTDDEIIEKAKKYFERSSVYESDQRKEEIDDIRFSGLLEQWPEVIRQMREGDPQGARPCLTVDKVNQYKNQIINNIRMNRPSIEVRPVDDNSDVEVAEIYEGLIRHIQDVNNADVAYDWAAEGAVTSGVGYFRIFTEFDDDSFGQSIKIQRIRNRFSVYFDPESKDPDGADQKECLITELVNKEEFKRLYPEIDTANWETSTGDNQTWHTDTEFRVAEYYWLETNQENLMLLDDGNVMYESDYWEKYTGNDQRPKVEKNRKSYRGTVCWAKLTAFNVIDHTKIIGKYIPVIPVQGIETDFNGKRNLRGIVRGVKDAQRMYNYNRSIIAESLNLTVKAPFIGYTGQFETHGEKWAAANRNNFAYLEADPVTVEGNLAPLPQRQGFAGVPTGLLQDIETSEHDIQSALGMYQASVGQDGNAKSGIAMNAQQKQGDVATFHFPDNLGRSIRHAGKILIGMIPVVYDKAQIARILGKDGTPDNKKIINDAGLPAVIKTPIDKVYNIGVGIYDVTVTVGQSFATKRMEGAQFMSGIVQSSPDLMPIIGDLMFKSMDMPYSDEIADRLKMMMPPQLQNNGQDSPEVQQVKAQASQHIQQLQQGIHDATAAIQQRDQAMQQMQTELKAKADKSQTESAQVMIDAYDAETRRMAVDLQAMTAKAAIDPSRIEGLEEALKLVIQHIETPLPNMETQQ